MTDLTIWQTTPFDAIIDHILSRYHDTHRQQLDEILPLAEKVSNVHQQTFNPEILPLIQQINAELRSHMMKEERMLFPMIKQGIGKGASMPINVMMHEHEEHQAAIDQLTQLTNDFTPPENACGSWQRLYAILKELTHDLHNHIELENSILFSRVMQS